MLLRPCGERKGPDSRANQYKLIDALPCIGKTDGIDDPSAHPRRCDRDTSFTVAYGISRAPKAEDVDCALFEEQGHAGNHDVLDAFKWIRPEVGRWQLDMSAGSRSTA